MATIPELKSVLVALMSPDNNQRKQAEETYFGALESNLLDVITTLVGMVENASEVLVIVIFVAMQNAHGFFFPWRTRLRCCKKWLNNRCCCDCRVKLWSRTRCCATSRACCCGGFLIHMARFGHDWIPTPRAQSGAKSWKFGRANTMLRCCGRYV